ncbi:MAG: hypothetical protein IMZ66_12050 [Planctomycetes bacterium]|nr:hypothetical protein [Planctomycetota bacterium]
MTPTDRLAALLKHHMPVVLGWDDYAARLKDAGVTLAPTPPDAAHRHVAAMLRGHVRHPATCVNCGQPMDEDAAPTPPDAPGLVVTVCPHSVDKRFSRCLMCEVPTPPDALDVERLARALHVAGVGCDHGMTGRQCGPADIRLPRPAHVTQAASVAAAYADGAQPKEATE